MQELSTYPGKRLKIPGDREAVEVEAIMEYIRDQYDPPVLYQDEFYDLVICLNTVEEASELQRRPGVQPDRQDGDQLNHYCRTQPPPPLPPTTTNPTPPPTQQRKGTSEEPGGDEGRQAVTPPRARDNGKRSEAYLSPGDKRKKVRRPTEDEGTEATQDNSPASGGARRSLGGALNQGDATSQRRSPTQQPWNTPTPGAGGSSGGTAPTPSESVLFTTLIKKVDSIEVTARNKDKAHREEMTAHREEMLEVRKVCTDTQTRVYIQLDQVHQAMQKEAALREADRRKYEEQIHIINTKMLELETSGAKQAVEPTDDKITAIMQSMEDNPGDRSLFQQLKIAQQEFKEQRAEFQRIQKQRIKDTEETNGLCKELIEVNAKRMDDVDARFDDYSKAMRQHMNQGGGSTGGNKRALEDGPEGDQEALEGPEEGVQDNIMEDSSGGTRRRPKGLVTPEVSPGASGSAGEAGGT